MHKADSYENEGAVRLWPNDSPDMNVFSVCWQNNIKRLSEKDAIFGLMFPG